MNDRPEAGEATRFFLHGSILIDFIGQPGSTSKWSLMGMDILVLGLQVVMLGLGIEKRMVQNKETRQVSAGRGQDLEAEEAGVVRSDGMGNDEGRRECSEGIEMQELLAGRPPGGEVGGQEGANVHPLDEFYTGNTVLARLDVLETITRDVMSSTSGSEGVPGSTTSGGVYLPGVLGIRWRSLR